MAELVVIEGVNVGSSFTLGTDRVLLGRSDSCAVSVQDGRVSKQHAEILRRGHSHILCDLGSSNGTYVNGAKLRGVHSLGLEDRIRVGGTTFAFRAGQQRAWVPTDSTGDELSSYHQPGDEGPRASTEPNDEQQTIDLPVAEQAQAGTTDDEADKTCDLPMQEILASAVPAPARGPQCRGGQPRLSAGVLDARPLARTAPAPRVGEVALCAAGRDASGVSGRRGAGTRRQAAALSARSRAGLQGLLEPTQTVGRLLDRLEYTLRCEDSAGGLELLEHLRDELRAAAEPERPSICDSFAA